MQSERILRPVSSIALSARRAAASALPARSNSPAAGTARTFCLLWRRFTNCPARRRPRRFRFRGVVFLRARLAASSLLWVCKRHGARRLEPRRRSCPFARREASPNRHSCKCVFVAASVSRRVQTMCFNRWVLNRAAKASGRHKSLRNGRAASRGATTAARFARPALFARCRSRRNVSRGLDWPLSTSERVFLTPDARRAKCALRCDRIHPRGD